MKRQAIIIFMLCALLALLTACAPAGAPGQTDPSAAPSPTGAQESSAQTPAQSAAPSVQETAEAQSIAPSEQEQAGGIDIENTVFPEEYDAYFGGDTKEAIKKLSPMFLAAAQAAYAADEIMEGEPSDVSKWAVAYQYLNSYGDADYESQEDGTLIVDEEQMQALFQTLFGTDGPLPELNTAYNIAYDATAGQYLIGRSDFGDVSFEMTELALGNPTAFATLTAVGAQSDPQFDVMIKITPNAESQFGYSMLLISEICTYT